MIESSLSQMGAALRAKKISSVELTQLFLDRIGRLNHNGAALNAFITVIDIETALKPPASSEMTVPAALFNTLRGIPIAVSVSRSNLSASIGVC